MIMLTPATVTATLLCTLLLAPPIAHRLTHPDLEHYAPVANQAERAAGKFEYVPFPNFPHIELVEEDSGETKLDLTALIPDNQLQDDVNNLDFLSLQVRNFTPQPSGAIIRGDDLVIPFTLSVKQKQSALQQGTLDLSGSLSVRSDGSWLTVTVEKYYDSNFFERLGRVYWLHERDNLAFAKAIAEPQLKHWLEVDPARVRRLIRDARRSGDLTQP